MTDSNKIFLELESYHYRRNIEAVCSLDTIIEQFKEQDELRHEKAEEAKRQRIEQEKAEERTRLRLEQEAIVRRNKISSLVETIKSDFYKENLLCKNKLSTRDMLYEYGRVREFCFRYLPRLKEQNFKLEKLKSEYVEDSTFNTFVDNWDTLSRAYFTIRRGCQGEDKVAEVLGLVDDCLFFLQNYKWDFEHDFIVIAPAGIFTIEVKTLHGDYILTETGLLKSVFEPNKHGTDVVLQSKRHLQSLRKNLKKCPAFHENIPLRQIICSGEGDFTIKNKFPGIYFCYYNMLDNYILSPDAGRILTHKDMQIIKKFLTEHKEPDATYDVFGANGAIYSRETFIDSFAAVAAVNNL